MPTVALNVERQIERGDQSIFDMPRFRIECPRDEGVTPNPIGQDRFARAERKSLSRPL